MPRILIPTKEKKSKTKKKNIILSSTEDFILLTDSREQQPFRFPREIKTEIFALPTGDYSVKNMEHLVCVERKSKQDMYSSLSSGRKRFFKEVLRMAEFEQACFVVTCTMEDFLKPPSYVRGFTLFESKFNPKSAINSLISWHIKYEVPTIFAGTHFLGMTFTMRFLEKFWKFKKGQEVEEKEEMEEMEGSEIENE